MTLQNIYHYVNQDVAKISSSLFLTIILIKNIHLSVAGQTFEVRIKKRLRRLWSRLTFLKFCFCSLKLVMVLELCTLDYCQIEVCEIDIGDKLAIGMYAPRRGVLLYYYYLLLLLPTTSTRLD